ncbi:protein containing Helix-turn-helix type 3 domain protein, partial [gut metagenome]
MELAELKLVTASNIIKLRTEAGMTQAELGAALNYSDKTISKWERGEAIPDAYVLTQMSEMFGVSIDSILSDNSEWKRPQTPANEEESYRADMIMAVSILGVWTLALTVFVCLWLYDIIWWKTFVVALPVAVLTHLV